MHYIYIMTNPAYEGYVKIGSTDRPVEERRKELSNPAGVMFPFEVFAYYETTNKLDDTTLHKIIDTINPNLRANKKREFYKMSPEDAYRLFEGISEISGTKDKLILVDEDAIIKSTTSGEKIERKAKFSFESAQIPKGAELTYIEDKTIKVVYNGTKLKNITYEGEDFSLSQLAQILLDSEFPVQGTLYFEYKGEVLNDRRARMEKEGTYK